jgi:hypothetical protein
MEGLESEAERLRAAAAVVRAELLQTESALARARGDSDRHRAAATAAEQQVCVPSKLPPLLVLVLIHLVSLLVLSLPLLPSVLLANCFA